MAEEAVLRCEVAYALPERQHVIELTLPVGTTAREAILKSGLCEQYPELARSGLSIGIFGQIIPPDRKLQDGDRVEIYRPLAVDPRAARRERVKRSR